MKIKHFWVSAVLIAIAGFAVSYGEGFAAEASLGEFSADMISRSGGETVETKFYSSGNKMRTETPGGIVIARPDKNIAYMVMPSERMYMEQPLRRQELPKTSKEMGGEVERVEMGDDIVDGKQVKKFKVIYDEGSTRKEAYQWLTDSGFPIKMEAVDGSWSVEYRNLLMGPQPESLFEPPAGFEKLSVPFAEGPGGQSIDDMLTQAGVDR